MVDILRTAVSGLMAFRTAMATTGHNVANVNTPYYSRQRVELGTTLPEKQPYGYLGTGVDIESVTRSYDDFLMKQLRGHSSSVSQYEKLNDLTGQMSALLGDTDVGLTPDLEAFFGSLQDLADSPASIPARQVFLDEARTLATRTQDINSALSSLRDSVDTGITHAVTAINDLSIGIAQINRDIAQTADSATNPPNDLLDNRDRMLVDLSKLVGIQAITQNDGSLSVFMGNGQPLVVGNSAFKLEAVQSGFDPQEITVRLEGQAQGSDLERYITSGELGGYFEFRRTILNPAQDGLGLLAIGLAETFNDQHEKGMNLDGELGTALFAVGNPKVWSHTNNDSTSAAAFTATVTDSTKLVRSDYEILYDGTNYTAKRLYDDKTILASGNLAALNTELNKDGLDLTLASGALTAGDRFLIQPTRYGAPSFDLNITDPRKVAAAAPIVTSVQADNVGSASISAGAVVDATDPALQNTVRIQFTSANTFDVLDLTAGTTLATGVGYASGGALTYNGWEVAITGSPQGSVSGSPITAGIDPTNVGTATIAPPTVNNLYDANLLNKVEIRFTSASRFDVFDVTQGTALASNVSYTSGGNITYNGWTTQITDGGSTPQAGDIFQIKNDGDAFQIKNNQGGIGDNRNALELVKLETKQQLLGGNDYRGVYAQMIAEVGAQGRRVESTLQSQEALLEQSVLSRESISGVSLDEEAANLVRFQQSYQAAAQVIQTSNSLFSSLLEAVRG
ncbi:MAG: flagellar hook-associated protein FlgK [Gammaproteobacteria bacterium]|nr:flagellar hook-associated protein FlgK [Gammaproteobacteria bacterium]MCP5195462.1 flagellar hook-associated protein FlgK [Gammaproteobacteria bacterium]